MQKKYRENKRHCMRIVFIFIDLQLSSLHTPRCVIINVSDFLFYVSVKVKSNLMKCESIFISLVKQRQLFIPIMESIFCGILIFIVCMFLYFESFLFQLSLFLHISCYIYILFLCIDSGHTTTSVPTAR